MDILCIGCGGNKIRGEMPSEQRIAFFSGSVQGVGFRYAACRVASRYEVTGYVRNLPDGRVECVLEGSKEEIDAFLVELSEAMSDYVSGREEKTSPYTGLYKGFSVRF